MPIEFTKHALERIKARGIEKKEIFSTLKKPDNVIENPEVKIAQKQISHQLLRIFYKEEGDTKILLISPLILRDIYEISQE